MREREGKDCSASVNVYIYQRQNQQYFVRLLSYKGGDLIMIYGLSNLLGFTLRKTGKTRYTKPMLRL